MHVIVLGSGVIGTTTAWYLAQHGARVTVLERQPGAALIKGTSAGDGAAGWVLQLQIGLRRPALGDRPPRQRIGRHLQRDVIVFARHQPARQRGRRHVGI